MIFRVVQELLGNASRHSQATLVKILLDIGNEIIQVSVDDNGKGFDPVSVLNGSSLGLKLIHEHARCWGAHLMLTVLQEKAPRISFSIPIHG